MASSHKIQPSKSAKVLLLAIAVASFTNENSISLWAIPLLHASLFVLNHFPSPYIYISWEARLVPGLRYEDGTNFWPKLLAYVM